MSLHRKNFCAILRPNGSVVCQPQSSDRNILCRRALAHASRGESHADGLGGAGDDGLPGEELPEETSAAAETKSDQMLGTAEEDKVFEAAATKRSTSPDMIRTSSLTNQQRKDAAALKSKQRKEGAEQKAKDVPVKKPGILKPGQQKKINDPPAKKMKKESPLFNFI